MCNAATLGRFRHPGQVREQCAELLGNLRAEHPSHHRTERPANLNRLADLCLCARGLDPAVEAKPRSWNNAREKREASPWLHIGQLHLVVLARLRVHDPGAARGESALPVHRRDVRIPLSPGRHVRPDTPDLFRRSSRLDRSAVFACHRIPLFQTDWAAASRSRGTSTTSCVFRKLSVTTLTTRSTAPTNSMVRSGAPCPTGAGSEKIRNSASG